MKQQTDRQTAHILDVSADISDNVCQFIVLFLHVKWLQDGLLEWRGGGGLKANMFILSAMQHGIIPFVSSSSISLFYSSAAFTLLTRVVLSPLKH
jgi:hypothetical protein